MITQNDIDHLIAAGCEVDKSALRAIELLAPIRHRNEINREHLSYWIAAFDELESDQIVFLIKGLTTAETALGYAWNGGSVSGVIWALHYLFKRDWQLAVSVAQWVASRAGPRCFHRTADYYANHRGPTQCLEEEEERRYAKIRHEAAKERERQLLEAAAERKQERQRAHLERLKEQKKRNFVWHNEHGTDSAELRMASDEKRRITREKRGKH